MRILYYCFRDARRGHYMKGGEDDAHFNGQRFALRKSFGIRKALKKGVRPSNCCPFLYFES